MKPIELVNPEADRFPIEAVRDQFPALAVPHDGQPRLYFDAPGGTQICRRSIARMVEHLETGTANSGGVFQTSRDTDAISAAAHEAMADLLNADAREIAFGPNMTSLTLALSRAVSQEWQTGDEIILSRLDHDANVTPWALAARDQGVKIRWLDFDVVDGKLCEDMLPKLLSNRTRLIAIGGASNVLGTLNDVARIAKIVNKHSDALIFVDAVQSVPHFNTDVKALGVDFLACSPYKCFGPRQGVLWGRNAVLERLSVYKLRPSPSEPAAVKFETGTPSFEAQAGVLGMIEYLEWLGGEVSGAITSDRRSTLTAAMQACAGYEYELGERLLNGLRAMKKVRLYGPPNMESRVPTFAFTVEGRDPKAVAEYLSRQSVHAWSGHFYGVEPVSRLGLMDKGGLVRIGLCHYNTAAEVNRFVELLEKLT